MNPILLHPAKLEARKLKLESLLLQTEALEEMEGQVKYEKPHGEKLAFQEGMVFVGAIALGILAVVLATPAQAAPRCDASCQKQTITNAMTRAALLHGRDKDCLRLTRHYKGDASGKALGRAARDECIANKARAEMGMAAEHAAKGEYTEHFDREGARRERASDRAIQINEGWQNRAAMDSQTDAIKTLGRESLYRRQNRAIEDQLRRIERNSQ